MKLISSASNTLIKDISKLDNKKEILKQKRFLVEGKNIIKEAIDKKLVAFLLVEQGNKFTSKDIEIIYVTKQIISKLSMNKTNEGVIAVCNLITNKKDISKYKNVILLDSINNPNNLGAITRTALCFGFDAIFLINDSTSIYNEKTIRSSQGAVFTMPVFDIKDIKELNDYNFYYFVLDGEKLSKTKFSKEKNCLVFGNEANGISKELLASKKGTKVLIEIENFESLNVNIAAGIAMYNLKYGK